MGSTLLWRRKPPFPLRWCLLHTEGQTETTNCEIYLEDLRCKNPIVCRNGWQFEGNGCFTRKTVTIWIDLARMQFFCWKTTTIMPTWRRPSVRTAVASREVFLSQKSKERFYESESVHVNNSPPFGFHWGTRMLPCPVSVTRSILMLVADRERQVVAVDAFETQAIPHRQMGIKGAHRCQCISCIFAFVLKQRRSSNRWSGYTMPEQYDPLKTVQ